MWRRDVMQWGDCRLELVNLPFWALEAARNAPRRTNEYEGTDCVQWGETMKEEADRGL